MRTEDYAIVPLGSDALRRIRELEKQLAGELHKPVALIAYTAEEGQEQPNYDLK